MIKVIDSRIKMIKKHTVFSFINNALALFILGLCIRIVYTLYFSHFFAQSYLNTNSVVYDGADFGAWLNAFKSLINTGSFTVNPDHPYGFFGRMPGYSFFIGAFYLVFGNTYYLYALIVVQILLDSFNIVLIYLITKRIFPSSSFTFLPGLIYAIHPINIIWTPVLMSECLSISLMIIGFYLLIASDHKWKYSLAGFIFGLNILVRPQIAILTIVIIMVMIYYSLQNQRIKTIGLKNSLLFCFFLGITYGIWPARNYIIHDKLIFTHDIRSMKCWSNDVYGFMCYIFSIQSNWDPQFNQIVQNKPFEVNKKIAYVSPSDSSDLARAVYLAQNCGSGFSHWAGYPKKPIEGDNCDSIVYELFLKLRDHQIKYNPWHYWIKQPFSNLNKCFFKSELSKPGKSVLAQLIPLIFLFRTVILFAGIIGCIILILQHHPYRFFFSISLIYFISWYALMCFGPTSFLRNIEMRYLIQADTLMIIPLMAYFTQWTSYNKKEYTS